MLETYGRPPLPPTTTTVPPFTLSAADMSKYGINDKNCGLKFTHETIDILYDTKCFHNSYSPLPVMDVYGSHLWRKQHRMTSRLMGGKGIARRGEAPWAVSIANTGRNRKPVEYFDIECSGVLIAKRWVLTAAECLIPQGKWYSQRLVKFGNYKVKGVDEVKCEVNHNYYGVRRSDGVALCLLERDVKFEMEGRHMLVNTVCLPESGQAPAQTELTTMYGFGVRDWANISQDWMHRGEVYLQPHSHCTGTDPEMVCSKNNVTTPCHGDYGAGVVKYTDKYKTRAKLAATLFLAYYRKCWTLSDVSIVQLGEEFGSKELEE
ncbi:unnamed protein product [Medioppia subpectinata]|uniref:Peptidase S1 domain-containing protein n=1 Tax=Medioppia subpectinata TaxID=1979941 RepID=A0A7R9LBY9_9ACAR|nr:unnamed protein product [Medioppia subpectinata]CAG2117614.1 unnamed protein product [Medioppia subpectinata]